VSVRRLIGNPVLSDPPQAFEHHCNPLTFNIFFVNLPSNFLTRKHLAYCRSGAGCERSERGRNRGDRGGGAVHPAGHHRHRVLPAELLRRAGVHLRQLSRPNAA
jgi:hypothetical protein